MTVYITKITDTANGHEVEVSTPNGLCIVVTLGEYDDAHLVAELLSRARVIAFNPKHKSILEAMFDRANRAEKLREQY